MSGASSGIGYVYWLLRLVPMAVVGMAIVIGVVWLLYPKEFRAERSRGAAAAVAVEEGASGDVLNPLPAPKRAAKPQVALAAFVAACTILISRRARSHRCVPLPMAACSGDIHVKPAWACQPPFSAVHGTGR